jgi:hypothetical protein
LIKQSFAPFSIDFNSTKNHADKPERGQRSYSTKEQQHSETDQEHVTKVEQVRHKHPASFQCSEPKDAVDESVERSASRSKEGEPPPPVILRAQLIIHQENRRFGTGHNQNHVDDQSKAEDVVELVHP